MTFTTRSKVFLAQEDGAMTTDFVVLTSGVLLAGMVIVTSLLPQITDFAGRSTKIETNNAMILQFTDPAALSN